MKRLVRRQHLELEIIAVLNEFVDIAAAAHDIELKHRDMKLEYRLTDKQYETYCNFLRTVASIIVNSDFEIIDEYQSAQSYSYYIQFRPKFYEGVGSDIVLDVKFRLSDHYKRNEDAIASPNSLGRSKSAGVVFKEFVVAGVTHDSIQSVVADIRDICNDLKVGDYSRFL